MVGVAAARHSGRSIAVIGGIVVLVVAGAVAATLTVGAHSDATFPAGSPQAAFQAYYRAYRAGDLDAAYGYFSADVRRQVSRTQYAHLVPRNGASLTRSGTTERLTVDGVKTDAGVVTLSLNVERVSGVGFDAQSSTYVTYVDMVHESGGWKIDEALVGIDQPLLPAVTSP